MPLNEDPFAPEPLKIKVKRPRALFPGGPLFDPQPVQEPQKIRVFNNIQWQQFNYPAFDLNDPPAPPVNVPEPPELPNPGMINWNRLNQAWIRDHQDLQDAPQPFIEPLKRPEYPGPEPKAPDNFAEAVIYKTWEGRRRVYFRILSHQPEPTRKEFQTDQEFQQCWGDWIESQGVRLPEFQMDFQKGSKDSIRLKPRGEATPKFFLPYTPEEMKLRLYKTIITVDSRPCFVVQAGENVRDSGKIAPGLSIVYSDGSGNHVIPEKHEIDLRPFEPGYIQTQEMYSEYYIRMPARIYRQGIHRDNTRVLDSVSGKSRPLPEDSQRIRPFLSAIEKRDSVVEFSPEIPKILHKALNDNPGRVPSLRLSNKVAVHAKGPQEKQGLQVLFKGIPCGTFSGSFRLNKDFCSLPYVRQELASVGIQEG